MAWVEWGVIPPGVDVDTDSDNTGEIDETPEEDLIEGEDPMGSGGGSTLTGNLIHLNRDDDDTNGVEDRLQGPGPLSFDDDELELMTIKVDDMPASDWVSGAAGGSEGLGFGGHNTDIGKLGNLR